MYVILDFKSLRVLKNVFLKVATKVHAHENKWFYSITEKL